MRDGEAADALHGEHRVEVRALAGQRLADDGHGQRVDRLEAAAVFARATTTSTQSGRGQPLRGCRGRTGPPRRRGRRCRRTTRREHGPRTAAPGTAAVSSKGRRVGHCMTSGTLWLKVRPSSSETMRMRCIVGVPPAMRPAVRVAVQPLDAVLLGVAVAAVQLHGQVGDLLGHLVGGALGQRDLERVGQPGAGVDRRPGRPAAGPPPPAGPCRPASSAPLWNSISGLPNCSRSWT